MKVYQIELDVDHYRALLPVDEGVFTTKILDFDCTPKGTGWVAPQMQCHHPLLACGDFWDIGSGSAFAVTANAIERVRTCFEMAGELLPLAFEGLSLTILNVTECTNCLDHDACKWLTTRDGQRIYPDPFTAGSYVFNPKRFTESSIFKIPEMRTGSVFCAEWDEDPELELKAAVEEYDLKGMSFSLLWEG